MLDKMGPASDKMTNEQKFSQIKENIEAFLNSYSI